METNNELVKQGVVSIPANVQKGWILAGNQKAGVAKYQEKKSLELQEIILHPGETITELTDSLAKYRKVHGEMVTAGQSWRTWLTTLALQPSLDIEKQYSPKNYDAYIILDKKLLDMRVAADSQARESMEKEREMKMYAAHVKNQYELIAADLKQRCLNEINTMYITYLKGKVKNPDVKAVKETISGFAPINGVRFESRYMTPQERKDVFNSVPQPDYNLIIEAFLDMIDQKFAGYAHDLKANTVEQVQQQAELELQTVKQEAAENVGINLLSAKAVQTPLVLPEGKAIKKTLEVVVEDTETWAILVITAFLKAPLCREYVTVKQWGNLTVKQMAIALGKWASESGEVDSSLQYKEVVK